MVDYMFKFWMNVKGFVSGSSYLLATAGMESFVFKREYGKSINPWILVVKNSR